MDMKAKKFLFTLIVSIIAITVSAQTGIFDKPVIVGFSGLSSAQVNVGATITLDVDVALNGATISGYTWYLDNTVIGNAKVCNYTILNTDGNKTIKIKIDSDKGSVEEEYKIITLGNTFSTEKNTASFPAGSPLDNSLFPVTIGQTFTDPVIDYTNGGLNTFYYVLKNGSTAPYTSGTTVSIPIPYLNRTFNCTVIDYSNFQSAVGANKTFFLEPGTFDVTITTEVPFSYNGLVMLGADATEKSVLRFNSSINFRTRMNTKIIWENLIIDGNNLGFNQNFITFGTESVADGLIMKNLLFRNIGNGTGNCRALFNFYEVEAARNYNVKRYFIDITVESARTSFIYDLININGADGIYFKNLDIQTTSGTAYPIAITNGTATTMGCQNVIIDGLTMPAGKNIRILRYNSRGISIPQEYRYLQLHTSWNPTSTSSYAIIATREANIATSATYAYLDAKTSSYLVRSSLSTAVNTQLTRINTLFGQAPTKAACTLPAPTIKLIGKQDGADMIIAPFAVPNLNNIPTDTVHLIATDNIRNPLEQTSMVMFKGDVSSRISINSAITDRVKLYNLDFSNDTLSTIYHATGVLYANSGALDKSAIYTENSFYNDANKSFYNCLFKDFIASPLGPLQLICVTLSGTPGICIGDPTATLNVSFGDYSNDGEVWTIKYKEKNNALAPVITQTITLPNTNLKIDPAPSATTSYVLVSAESDTTTAFVSGTGIVTVYDKMSAGSHKISVITKDLPDCIFERFKQSYLLTVECTNRMLTYQWYFNDKPIEGATSNSYLATRTGLYHVKVKTVCDDLFVSNTCRMSFCDEDPISDIQRGVRILPHPSIETNPSANMITYVKGWGDFVFTIKAKPGYSLDNIVVKTGIRSIDEHSVVYNRISGDSMQVTIRQVTRALLITIEGVSPVGNEVSGSQYKAWAYNGQLYFNVPEKVGVQIFTLAGALYHQRNLQEGNCTVNIGKGAYIIVFDNGIRQKVFIR